MDCLNKLIKIIETQLQEEVHVIGYILITKLWSNILTKICLNKFSSIKIHVYHTYSTQVGIQIMIPALQNSQDDYESQGRNGGGKICAG